MAIGDMAADAAQERHGDRSTPSPLASYCAQVTSYSVPSSSLPHPFSAVFRSICYHVVYTNFLSPACMYIPLCLAMPCCVRVPSPYVCLSNPAFVLSMLSESSIPPCNITDHNDFVHEDTPLYSPYLSCNKYNPLTCA